MVLSGGSLPPRASRSTKLNSDPDRSSSPRIRPPPPKRKTTESHHDSAGQRLFQRPARGAPSPALLRGRSRHAVAVVLDLGGVGLPLFSIMVVRQGRLRGRASGRSPLGHYDAPSSVDLMSERAPKHAPPHAEPPSRIASEQLA